MTRGGRGSSATASFSLIAGERSRWLAFLRSRGLRQEDAEDVLQSALLQRAARLHFPHRKPHDDGDGYLDDGACRILSTTEKRGEMRGSRLLLSSRAGTTVRYRFAIARKTLLPRLPACLAPLIIH